MNLRLFDETFGDFVRRLMATNTEFKNKVQFYKNYNTMAERHPEQYRVSWGNRYRVRCSSSRRVCYETKIDGKWSTESDKPAYIGDDNDDILSYRLAYEKENRINHPTI